MADVASMSLSQFVSSRPSPQFIDPEALVAGNSKNPSLPKEKLCAFQDAVKDSPVVCVLLAAGQGSRFVADTPKVIYPFKSGDSSPRPLGAFSILAAVSCKMPIIVVVGHERARVAQTLHAQCPPGHPIVFVVQDDLMGTGHAVYLAKFALPDAYAGSVVVSYADNPGVDGELLRELLQRGDGHMSGRSQTYGGLILTGSRAAAGEGAAAYGRIVRQARSGGSVVDIVERKTIEALKREGKSMTYGEEVWMADELEKIDEFNSGIVVVRADHYMKALGDVPAMRTKVEPEKYEFYATDFVKGMVGMGRAVEAFKIEAGLMWKLEGANTVEELRELEEKNMKRMQKAAKE